MIKQRKLTKAENEGKTPLEKFELWGVLNPKYIQTILDDINMWEADYHQHLGRPGQPDTILNWLYINLQKGHKKDWGRFLKSWLANTRRYANERHKRGNPSDFSGASGERKMPKI